MQWGGLKWKSNLLARWRPFSASLSSCCFAVHLWPCCVPFEMPGFIRPQEPAQENLQLIARSVLDELCAEPFRPSFASFAVPADVSRTGSWALPWDALRLVSLTLPPEQVCSVPRRLETRGGGVHAKPRRMRAGLPCGAGLRRFAGAAQPPMGEQSSTSTPLGQRTYETVCPQGLT